MVLALLIAAVFGLSYGLATSLWLVPLAGAFFAADSRLLHSWREQTLRSWVSHSFDFYALADTIRALISMPKSTLEGMFESLPHVADLSTEQDLNSQTRRLIAFVISIASRYRMKLQFLKLFVAVVLAAISTAALLTASIALLIGIVPLSLLALAIRQYWQAIPEESIIEIQSIADLQTCDVETACTELGNLARRQQLDALWIKLIRSR